ncbi:MAG: dockerin type I repeat-containing protein [Bacteroidaceae bacterium]|nr:dockerin type I repeat-containing protein [Bacteroidaceae bacterium]
MKRKFTSSSTLWSCLIALVMMMGSQSAWAEYVKLTALSGTGGTGGEGYASLVDANVDTKMGHSFDPANPDRALAYIIVKAEKAVVPKSYFLVTGTDTGSYPTRNWKSWKIFGANFASDADAQRGDIDDPAASGWTLLDDRENEKLPEASKAVKGFQFDYEGETAFQYYWIEITESVAGGDIWLQMSEWGLGTYSELEQYLKELSDQGTTTDEPVKYSLLSGDPAGFGGEGVGNLIDGKTDNKWCCSFTNREEGATANGGYIIFKASRTMAPTYYSMVTGNDTGNNPGRNWKQWHIYGMNADDDDAVTRTSEKWVVLDDKYNVTAGIGLNQLPAANFAQAYFTLSVANTTAYKYFKIELDQCVTSGLMQMSEFSLGDEYVFALDRNALLTATAERYNAEDFAEKTLYDQMAELVANIKACSDPITLGQLTTAVDELVTKINASKNLYAELVTVRNSAINQLKDNNVADAAVAYVNGWISETDAIAPNDDYPCGNYAYILANRQITGAEASAEAKRFSAYLQANVKVVDDPIGEVGYEFLTGTTDNWNAAEGPGSLIDGDRTNTKWGTATSGDRFVIFKSNEPIKPTYYGLVTGGDTGIYTDRNWKNWKIWAANFNSDEEATKDAEGWVLIDVKENVGTDVLKTTSLFESYINLSIGCTEPYQYFKIEVYHSGGMQMNEFTFYNMGDLVNYREEFIEEFKDYDPDEEPAYKGYTDAYKAKYEEMCNATYAPDLMKFKNELKDLQDLIASSVEKYIEYEDWYSQLTGAGAASEGLQAWFDGYTSENVGPNSMYINGTHAYIMENLNLDNEQIGTAADIIVEVDDDNKEHRTEILPSGEIGYIQNMVNAVNDGVYILLGGHTVGQWGDGFYGHLIDGIALNSKDEEGNTINATKWGGAADANGDTYIIFRTLDATNPFFYTLTTGNDTGSYPSRNWGTWYIYGANFVGDADAKKDAEGWVLIDSKENVGQDRLHPVNAEPSYFGFSTGTTEKYTYYKVVVTKAYEGTSIQMNELHFGTPEEFEEIKTEYRDNAEAFETDIIAEQALIDQYKETIPEIEDCANMEELFVVNYKLETLREQITASAKVYTRFSESRDDLNQYLEENNLDESEALTTLKSYIGDDAIEPNEAFIHGSVEYILENHVLADSVVAEEIEFMESLKSAAVLAGYVAGTDISAIIVNRSFAVAEDVLDEKGEKVSGTRKAEGWDGYLYTNETNEAGTMSAAEFCNEQSKFNISQTLKGLKNGYYEVKLNAGFRPNGNINSFNYAAMAFANDTKTFVPAVREFMEEDKDAAWSGTHADKEIYYCDVNDPVNDPAVDSVVVGYVIWGVQGTINAILHDRYEITMVAKVTNGNLKFGLKNEGTTVGGDWLGAGNFRLKYLGEDAADAIAAAAEYNGDRATTLTDVYVPESPDEATDYKTAPNFGAAQIEALASVANSTTVDQLVAAGNLFEEIYATKAAYYELCFYKDAVLNKWQNHPGDVEDDIFEVADALSGGSYENSAAAKKAQAELLAKYPDYLEISEDEIYNVEFVEGEGYEGAFEYEIEADGKNPWLVLKTLYDDLKEDEVLLTFDYKTTEAIEGGYMEFGTKAYQIQVPTLAPATEWTPVTIDITDAIKDGGFGKANHTITWHVVAKKADELSFSARHFIINAKPDNTGDITGDNDVTVADVSALLTIIANGGTAAEYPAADITGDGEVTVADLSALLTIIANKPAE